MVKKGDNVTLGGRGVTPSTFFLAQIYQGLKSLGNGLCTLTNWPQNVICVHTCMHCGLMCGIWDWQFTLVKDLNDSQDPQHTLFCRENAFVAIYGLFSDNKSSSVFMIEKNTSHSWKIITRCGPSSTSPTTQATLAHRQTRRLRLLRLSSLTFLTRYSDHSSLEYIVWCTILCTVSQVENELTDYPTLVFLSDQEIEAPQTVFPYSPQPILWL